MFAGVPRTIPSAASRSDAVAASAARRTTSTPSISGSERAADHGVQQLRRRRRRRVVDDQQPSSSRLCAEIGLGPTFRARARGARRGVRRRRRGRQGPRRRRTGSTTSRYAFSFGSVPEGRTTSRSPGAAQHQHVRGRALARSQPAGGVRRRSRRPARRRARPAPSAPTAPR